MRNEKYKGRKQTYKVLFVFVFYAHTNLMTNFGVLAPERQLMVLGTYASYHNLPHDCKLRRSYEQPKDNLPNTYKRRRCHLRNYQLLQMNFSIFILLIAIVFLTGQAAIFSSYPAYQNSNWHYDNYGNLMIGNRDNGFYMGPCFGPECPWGK
ncbi:hypothetical protein L5515_019401 [Caenorhabditis briggsae]|uniref:Uncharacterized protein n=1 Tax=Caenorhabditis briggsae TaxID=6238 RepID=A0AAE9FIB4_CAEBR|nr:hypothetical protein L5515_019401 [Caenorhabditis briggsae]